MSNASLELATVTMDRDHWHTVLRALLVYSGEGGPPDRDTEREVATEARAAIEHAWRADDSTAAGRPVSVAFRVNDQNPAHARVSLFIGRSPGMRGHAGDIVVRADELLCLRAAGWEEIE